MKNPVLIFITAQESCKLIIEKGQEMARQLGTVALVFSAQPKKAEAEVRSHDMKILDSLSKATGAEITVIFSDEPLHSLAEEAKKHAPVHIFTGRQSEDSVFVSRLSVLCNTPITMVSSAGMYTVPPAAEFYAPLPVSSD